MPNLHMVDAMERKQEAKQTGAVKRKTVLSPEVTEFLHMLKSLETEFTMPAAKS
jgi:hypothetical protein